MIGELSIYGLYIPWILPFGILTLVFSRLLRSALARSGFYRMVWHPALFDLALYVVLLYLVWRFSPLILMA
jgi:hypothetical protein